MWRTKRPRSSKHPLLAPKKPGSAGLFYWRNRPKNGGMPELPEVETTRRGIEPHAVGRKIVEMRLYEKRLRWKVQEDLPDLVARQVIRHAKRRAKYLKLKLDSGTLMLHLGMSGSLRVLPAEEPHQPHEQNNNVLSSGNTLRFND